MRHEQANLFTLRPPPSPPLNPFEPQLSTMHRGRRLSGSALRTQHPLLCEAFEGFGKSGSPSLVSAPAIRRSASRRHFGHVDSRLSFGYVSAPALHETNTRPKRSGTILKEQLASHAQPRLASRCRNPRPPIPLHFAFGEGAHVEASAADSIDIPLRDLFDAPGSYDHRRRDRQRLLRAGPGEPSPLAPFTRSARLFARAPQPLYRDQRQATSRTSCFSRTISSMSTSSAPGRASRWRRRQRLHRLHRTRQHHHPRGCRPAGCRLFARPPAADARLSSEEEGHGGITLVNIGVGPSNARTITDHIAVLRPHVWLMLGIARACATASGSGDYVLAHAYMREDHVLDDDLPV